LPAATNNFWFLKLHFLGGLTNLDLPFIFLAGYGKFLEKILAPKLGFLIFPKFTSSED
jgi:hypothetical protein